MRASSMLELWLAVVMGVLVAGGAVGCSNDGGRLLGPSGIGSTDLLLSPTCQIPCETVEDCRRFSPRRSAVNPGIELELPFAWLRCDDGVCIDVECIEDTDCANHLIPDRQGRPCVHNQCAPACGADGTCQDSRDACMEGVCLRQPEIPDPNCEGPGCECLTDADCPIWEHCRASNFCEPYQSDFLTAATGRVCSSDGVCAEQHLAQDMLDAGLNPELLTLWGLCGQDLCSSDRENPFSSCGDGFTCVPVTEPLDPSTFSRTTCVPEVCAPPSGTCEAGFGVCLTDEDCGGETCLIDASASGPCAPSRRECARDADCPGAETCTWPWSGCAGVCLDLACEPCGDWLSAHRTRSCIDHTIDLTYNVRRPD